MPLPSRRACSAAFTLVFVVMLAGCTPAEAPPPTFAASSAPPTRVVQDDAGALVLPELMAFLVDPAAGVLLAAADLETADLEGGGDAEPRTAEAWQAVADAAVQLAQTSEALAQPALALGRADWLQWAAALREGAVTGGAAAGRHEAWDLAEAGARIRASCRACHARYAPEAAETSSLHIAR